MGNGGKKKINSYLHYMWYHTHVVHVQYLLHVYTHTSHTIMYTCIGESSTMVATIFTCVSAV